MKLYPVLLLALTVFVSSQPEFFALFDFSVPKINGASKGNNNLYGNLMSDTDTDNLFSLKEVFGDGGEVRSLRFNLVNDKTTPYTSAIVLFDDELLVTTRRLSEYSIEDTLKYRTSSVKTVLDNDTVEYNLTVDVELFGSYYNVLSILKKENSTMIALAINIQTIENSTKVTVYYLDSDNDRAESTMTFEYNNPSLLSADYIKYDHFFGNFYYAGFSHQEINRSVFESWVGDFVNFDHKKAECSNCGESMTCPANAHLRPLFLGMRKYKCTCKEDSAVYEETVGTINCMKLATGKDCNFGCASGCATIDPNMCYANCTPGYNCTALKNNFVTCTPIPGDHESIWFWLFVITIPIFIAAYIGKIIFYVCYKPPKSTSAPIHVDSYPSPRNSPTISRIVTSGPASPIPMHKKPSVSAPDSEIDSYKPSLKAEDEKEFNLGSSSKQSDSEKDNSKECKLCGRVREDLIAAFKCRHADVCRDCLKNIKRCPTCGNNALLLK